MHTNEIVEFFRQHKFRATPQRVAVYKYLWENRTHPDVEEIYHSVVKDNPSFSKTTVYNSVEALAEYGLIIPVRIDSQRIHYDANPNFHGHFICNCCKKIFDFDISKIENKGIDNFNITQQDVYYSGLCPQCNNQ